MKKQSGNQPEKENNADFNAGHRARLKNRYLKNGIDSLYDYEVLELFLTYPIPRKDVKPLAKRLLKEFGSLSGVFNASPEALINVPGVGPGVVMFFRFYREFIARCLEEKMSYNNLFISEVRRLAQWKIGNSPVEKLLMLFFNAEGVLVKTSICDGDESFVSIEPQNILLECLKNDAKMIALAHNHPNGSLKPSEQDISFTEKLQKLARNLGLDVFEHWIITATEYYNILIDQRFSKSQEK